MEEAHVKVYPGLWRDIQKRKEKNFSVIIFYLVVFFFSVVAIAPPPSNPSATLMKCFLTYSSDHPFPIENLPYGVFTTQELTTSRIGVAIADYILDLTALSQNESLFQNSNVSSSLFQQVGPEFSLLSTLSLCVCVCASSVP